MPTAEHVYPLRGILTKAWLIARAGARRFGGTVRAYLAAALRQAWAKAKALERFPLDLHRAGFPGSWFSA